jgi:lysophospholipase L1-like esterase
MNGIRRALFQVVILLFSSVVCLGLAEAGLRLKNSSMKNYDIEMWRYAKELKTPSADPLLGHEHVKSRSAVLQSVTIRLNERGLRGGPLQPRVPGKRRILVLGSSITLGWGVPEEDTLTAQLQQMFQKDGQDVEVLNAGIGNYNAVRCVELFLKQLADLQPTDIVLHYFVNGAEVLEPGGGNILLRNSEVAVTLWQVANRTLSKTGEASLDEHYRTLYAPGSRGRTDMEAAVKRLADYARGQGIPLYLAMTPDVHNLADYRFGYIHELMADVAKKNGYVFVDFLTVFRGLQPTDIFAMPGDPHPNGLGHLKMAQVLYPVLTGKS